MAVQNEVIKLLLQFETAFTSKDEFSTFVNGTIGKLGDLDKKLEGSGANLKNYLQKFQGINKASNAELAQLFDLFKELPETNVLQNNAKIIRESINLIDQALSKKLDVSNLQDSLSKIQQAFIPKSNKSSEFAQTFLSNLEKQFQAFGSGSLNLNQFFENLFPKEITAKSATAKIKAELAKLKETVENNINDLENLTPKKRFEILQKIADTILADTTKVSVASTSVKATTQELITAISTMVRSFAAIEFKPPADFFAPYFQALKLSAKKEGEILREILSNLIASFNTNNIQLQKGNQVFSILESLGFSKATIEKEFDSLNTFALRKFKEFNENINIAAQSKTLDIRSPITDFQKFMSDAFTKNSLSGFSEEFQKQFEKVKNELQGFSSVKSQTLSDFQAFKTGVMELNAALDSGKGAGTPTALALKELLNTYLQFEGAFRFKEVLDSQKVALNSFGERVTELQKNLQKGIGIPKDFVPQFLTSDQAGEAAILSRNAAMELYDKTVSDATRKVAELKNAINNLESTKSQASTVEQQTALEKLIKSYKEYEQSLNQEIVALNASREAWNANWVNKLKDVDFAKEKINAFLAALNKPVDGSNITSYLGSIIKIGLESAEAKNVLEGSFQKFGGITKEALQNVELFQRALTTLFASTGTGAEKVTLIDLNSLKTQADSTTVATGHLQEQLLKLAGTSTAAREQFDLLSFAVNFLKQVGGDTSIFGEQLNSLHKLAQGTRSYLSVIELLEIRLESYRGTLAKIESSQNAVNIRLATANAAKGDDRALAIQDLSAAYKELSRDLIKAEDQLKKLKETEQGLKEKKAQFGIEDGGQFTLLQTSIANAEKEVNKLKETLNTLKTTDKSGILKSVIEDIDKGNEQIQNSLTKLQEQAAKKLASVLETIRNQLARTTLGKELSTSVTQQIDALSTALNSVNLSGALAAITALQSEIQKAFTDKTNSSVATKELAETYLKPYQELLKGVESIAVKLATALPTLSLATTEKTKIGTELDAIRIKIQETNAVLATFGSTANTAQLTTRFKEVQDKVIALKTELQGLNAGTIDSAKIGEIQTRFSDVRKELIDLNKEARALNLKDTVSPLTAEINTIKESLKELGKGSRLEGLQSQFDKLKTAIPPVIADIDGLKKLLQDSFAGNKELVNTAPFVKLKNDLQAIERTITDTEQKAPYTRLIAQVQDAIEKTERYNAVVKSGSSRDVGIQAVITPESYTKTVQALKDLDAELIQNRTSLSQFLISSNQTAEGAKQLATSFAITRESFRDLKQVAGELSGTSSNLDKHIRDLLRAGEDASIIKVFKDIKTEIDSAIKTKESLNKAFQGGFTKDLETDLNRLVTAKTLMEQFRAVGDSFKSAAFFDSTSYSARQAFEQIQRLESAMRTAKNNIDQSLSVGRRDTIDAGVSSQLSVQRADLDANIIKLKELGQVYDQLRSKPKIEIFEQLKNTFENITGNGRTQLQAYKTEFETTISGVTASIASLKGGVAPLTQTLVDSFKQQSESIAATRTQYEEFLKILRSMGTAGYTKFQFADGSEIGIGRLIVTLKNLLEQANAVKAPIEQASNELKDKLGTAAGQAELRISNLITKFTQLQDRINTINPGSSINEIYGSVKELMMLLNQPYKTGPFFTLPKEGFAPIQNELKGMLEIAKNVQHGLQTNLNLMTPGTKKYQDTELQIKAVREEVERLTAASQRLSEFEKNASHFSALRGNLHGASTTLQELAHEGAFIYKGLEALFKNLAKNLTGPVVTINTATLNQQLDQLTTKFGVTGAAADHLKTQVKEALNQQLGGGGLAAAEQYQKAFQQLEEAFVKFRSGLTQAAMGFQMLGDSLLEPFKKAKERFEEFSDTMGVVNAVSNATQAQFKALTDQALLMGATTRFTAEQAAEGLKQLAKAGYTAEEQIATLPTVMRLAQAAATDLATAASVATVVMKEFRMDPDQFNEAADKITLAANRTLGTVEDLGFSFKYVGALAANIGADFGDLTAAIGLLHNAGLKGTLSGTALRGMLMALYNPTRDETKLIAELGERIGGLGLQIQDASGNFVGYGKIVKQLEQAGITTGEVLRFFGQRAGPGMAALLAQGSEALKNLEDDLRNAEGTTAHMAEIMEQTLKGRLLLMRSAFEALSDSIGHNLAPTLAAAANAMAEFVSRFVAVRQEFPALATAVDHVLAGFALFASVLGGLAVTFAFIIVPVRQFMGFLKTLIVTTLAGAGAITSLSAAQAFNAKVTAATMVAVEAEFRARIASATATAGATAAINYNTIAAGINVVAIREQTAALLGATAAAGANAAAQTGLWIGLKNVILGLGRNLLNIGGMLRFAFLTPLGLVLTAITGVVAYTLLHEKSVAQTNVELDKQSQIIEYSRKNIVKLNEELLSSAEQLKRNQQALNELRSGDGPERDLLGQEDQTTSANLQLDIDKGKKDIQKQLKELFTQITESSTYKDLVNFKIEFDAGGAFKQFTTVLKDGNKEFEILGDNLEFNTDQLKDFTKALDETASAQKRKNAEEKIANELGRIIPKDTGQTFDVFKAFDITLFDTDFEKNLKELEKLEKTLPKLQDKIEKLKKGATPAEVGYQPQGFEIYSGVAKSAEEYIQELQKAFGKASQLRTVLNEQLNGFKDYFLKTLPEIFGQSLDELATQSVSQPDILKNLLQKIFDEKKFDPKYFDAVFTVIQDSLNERAKNLTTEQLVGENLKKPVIGLVNATKDLVTYLEATNKELKTKIDEQKKIFDEAKVVVDAVKAYQTAIAAAAKDTLDVRNQEIEFEAKIETENLDRSFEEQLRTLEDANRVIELPFKAKLITETADTSGFKALSGLSGLLLDYEKKNTAEFVKIQSTNSEQIKKIKLTELNDKQAATEQYYQTLKDHYSVDSADYLKAQQEQASATKENLDSRLEAVQDHLKDLLKLYQDNAKAIIDLEKQKKQFQAAIEQTKVNFGNAQLLPTEQLQKAKFDLSTLDAQIQGLLKEEKFDDAIARLNEYQKLVDQIATSAGAQPELTLKVANLAENLEFDLDRIDFEKEFNKANIRITAGAKGLGDAFSSTFTKFKPLSSSFVPQLESGAVDVKKALQTVVRVYGEEVDKLKKKDAEGFQGLGEGISTLQYASSGILKSFGKSFDDNLRFKKAQKDVEAFGDMMENAFNVRPVTDLVKGVNDLDARLSQVTQAQNALNEFGIPGESASAVPLLSNISETGEKGIITLRNVKGEMIALSLQAKTEIKPLEGLTTDIQKGKEALVGFKSLIDTQIDDLSRGDKVVELPISFKTDFNAFDTSVLAKYHAEVLSYEKNLNKEVLDLQLKRINATLEAEQKAVKDKQTVVENQISTIETLYDKQLGEMQNWSKQDLDAYKSNIESKKSSLVSFLQEELSATQSTYNELFQIRANLLNKNRALDEQYISFQANATKNFQTIDDLGKSDSQKTYETRLKSLNIQADADAALAQGDYDRAKALLEQRQQLIDAAVNSLKPEDTIGKFFLKQDQTEAVESYKKVTDALKVQNQSAVKEVEAQLNSVNGQILALKQSADTAKAALQDLLNKLFELSTKKFQAEVEVIQKNTQQAENLGEQAYSGAIAQRKDIGKTLLQDREKVKKEEQGLIKLYQQQVVELRKIIDIIKEKQLVKIGIDPDAYEEVLAYAKFYLDTMDAISKDQVETQLAKTKLTDLENQYKELQKLKQANQELLVVQKQLEQVTATQKQLGGLVGFSNTITTATTSAKSLADVFTTLEDKETGLNTEELASANKILEALRKSSQGVREDFKKIEVDETVQNRLAEIFGLFETDVSKLKGEELKSFVSQMTTALKDLEGFQRDVNTKIAGEAKNTALSTIAEVQASVLKIEGILKDAKIAPEVKDISLKEIRKQLEDQLKNLQITIDTADKSGNQEQIAALAPLKDLLLEVNKITKSNLSDEDKITRLLNIKNTLAQKQKELTVEQMESARRASEIAEKQKRIQEQNLNTSKAQSTAAKDTAKAQESIAQAADKTDKVWAKTTLKDQSIALNAVQGMIDEINQTGFYLVKPEDQDSITKLFNQLKDAQANLNQAIQSGDTAAITKAITEIKELGIQFKNTAGLSDAARQKFSELANIPSIDVAIKANTSSIPPAKQAVKELQDQAKQDTSVTMSTEEVALAVTKLKDVENEVTKLKGLSAVEFKDYTNVDVEKSKQELETFAQRAKTLLEVPISARDEEFKAKLRALFVDYDQFRSQLQPIKIEGEANSFNETYQKALSTLQNLRDQATFVGATEQAQKYSEILNKVLQARLNIQSNDINIRTQGYENLKTLIDGTQELKTALTEADKKSLNIKITTVGKDVVLSDIASIGTELDNTKNKARSLDATLKEVRSGLSETATVPGLETPAAAFDELNNKLTDTRTRLKDAFAKGDLNTDGLNTFKNNIQNLIDKMSQVKGVTPDMVKALREAVDVELKDYTVKVIPEIQPMEERAEPTPIELAPEPLEIPTPPPVTILTEVEPLAPVELESPTVTVTALVDQAVSGIGQVLSMLNALPSSRTVVINTVYRTSGSPPTQNRNQGGLIGSLQHFAEGGLTKFKELASAFVPGIGNTDTVPAMLTPGEFVIKKERVKSLGIGFLNALNNGLLQFKAAGGMVYNSPINTLNKMSDYVKPNYQIPQQAQSAGGPPIDINLTIKDKTFSIKTPRDEAKKLVSALQYLERGITKK